MSSLKGSNNNAPPGVPDWMVDDTPTSSNDTSEALPGWAKTGTSADLEQPAAPQPLEIEKTTQAPTTSSTTNGDNSPSNAAAASNKTWSQYFAESFKRDGRLLLVTLAIIIVMNIPFIKWILYPFSIFSTWIHELCHGLAAVFTGGKINKLLIYPDTSGLAYTTLTKDRRGFVSSAGYQGTAVIGCLLLLFRRTKRGPRTGTMAVAFMMILSVLLWIRNAFGIVFILLLGAALAVMAWQLPSTHMRNMYLILAVTCSLNAITSVHNLFGSNHQVNGEPVSTDAHTMADLKGGTSGMWAFLWLLLALVLTVVGILFAIPGPDEVADFTCCGVCQDLGLFRLCNYPGQRLLRRMRGSTTSTAGGEASTTG